MALEYRGESPTIKCVVHYAFHGPRIPTNVPWSGRQFLNSGPLRRGSCRIVISSAVREYSNEFIFARRTDKESNTNPTRGFRWDFRGGKRVRFTVLINRRSTLENVGFRLIRTTVHFMSHQIPPFQKLFIVIISLDRYKNIYIYIYTQR